jgi:hypothetical protein
LEGTENPKKSDILLKISNLIDKSKKMPPAIIQIKEYLSRRYFLRTNSRMMRRRKIDPIIANRFNLALIILFS